MKASHRLLVFLSLTIFLVTEFLSVFKLVNRLTLVIFWAVILALLCIFSARRLECIKEEIKTIPRDIKKYPLFSIIIGIAVLSLFIAICTVPYNHDSMTYHLARVAFWEQNHSIGHYATSVIRQISSPVFAEILCLQIYIITGHMMNLCNLVQSTAFIVTAYCIFHILADVGVKREFAYISVVVFMTMPIAFSESVSTQNDLVVSMWFIMFVSEIVALLTGPENLGYNKRSLIDVLTISGIVSLVYITKPSALFGVIVFLFFSLPIFITRRERPGILIFYCFIGGITVLALCSPEIIRNIHTFGSIVDNTASGNIMVGTISPQYIFVNFLKNFTFNLPSRLSPYIDTALTAMMKSISDLLNVPIDDPSISLSGSFKYNDPVAYNFDYALNPLTEWSLILGVIALVILFVSQKKSIPMIRKYILMSGIVSFIFFCVILRWQEWGTRLMLPYLSLLCVLIGIIIDEVFPVMDMKWGHASRSVVVIILFLSITGGLNSIALQIWCAAKGRFGKKVAVFATIPDLYYDYRSITDAIIQKGYKKIGIAGEEGLMEFPFFVLMDNKVEKIYHVCVENASNIYSDLDPPDCIIWKRGVLSGDAIEINGAGYTEDYRTGETILLVKDKMPERMTYEQR